MTISGSLRHPRLVHDPDDDPAGTGLLYIPTFAYALYNNLTHPTFELLVLRLEREGGSRTKTLYISALVKGATAGANSNVTVSTCPDRIFIRRNPSHLLRSAVMLETSRRKTLDWMNSRYIYGKIPLLHTVILLIEFAMVARLIAKFNSYYSQKPLLTTMITNAILGGIADSTAQFIAAYRTRQLALPMNADTRNFISSGVELEDLNEKPARFSPALSPTYSGPPAFDFERLTRFMSYGFLMTPLQFKWYGLLSKWFPVTPQRGTIPALQRVAMDQLLFAPCSLAAFFTFMTIAEGGGKKHLIKKFQDIYIPTLRANYILWPAAQILNFRVMPLQFQIPFVSTIGIAWTAYLSLSNATEDETMDV